MKICQRCGPMPDECVDTCSFDGVKFELCGICALEAVRIAHSAPTYFFQAPEAKRKYRIAKEYKATCSKKSSTTKDTSRSTKAK